MTLPVIKGFLLLSDIVILIYAVKYITFFFKKKKIALERKQHKITCLHYFVIIWAYFLLFMYLSDILLKFMVSFVEFTPSLG